MPSKFQQAIIKTIIYADIFDYPLTWEEVGKWLIRLKMKNEKLKITMQNSKLIKEKDGYYFLPNRESIVELRKKRRRYSEKKWKIVRDFVRILRFVPTIKLVGVSGALAIHNVKEDDDIDLFIVASRNLLWTTRLLATLLVKLTGKRRHPQDKNIKDKICLNMFADEDHLGIPEYERDLFSAHEVLQMKPIWEKDNMYHKFLKANEWVRGYLPNAYRELTLAKSDKNTSDGGPATAGTPPRRRNQVIKITETLLKKFQLWYMRNRRTTEVIKEGIIRFHPQDARVWVLKEFKERIDKL